MAKRPPVYSMVGLVGSCWPIWFLGCSIFYPTRVPIPAVYHSAGDSAADAVLVMLPGRGAGPEDYQESGFVRMIGESGLSLDAIAVDAHFGYYYSRTLIDRLRQDVILPTREKGHRRVWLLGISMGGLGALLFAQAHPDLIEGVVVLAPFLGDDEVIEEIVNAGGLANWVPPDPIDPDDYQRSLWRWLKQYAGTPAGLPKIHLGWGSQDNFARANGLLARVLPTSQVYTAPGGHTWKPWIEMFAAFLRSGEFSQRLKPLALAGPKGHSGWTLGGLHDLEQIVEFFLDLLDEFRVAAFRKLQIHLG